MINDKIFIFWEEYPFKARPHQHRIVLQLHRLPHAGALYDKLYNLSLPKQVFRLMASDWSIYRFCTFKKHFSLT